MERIKFVYRKFPGNKETILEDIEFDKCGTVADVKLCNKCNKIFKHSNFYKNGNRYQAWCKYCESVRKKGSYQQ